MFRNVLVIFLALVGASLAYASANCQHSSSWQCRGHHSTSGVQSQGGTGISSSGNTPNPGTTNPNLGQVTPPQPAITLAPVLAPTLSPQAIPSKVPQAKPSKQPIAVPSQISGPQAPIAKPPMVPQAVPPKIPVAVPGRVPQLQAPVAVPNQVPQAIPPKQPMAVPSQRPSKLPPKITVLQPPMRVYLVPQPVVSGKSKVPPLKPQLTPPVQVNPTPQTAAVPPRPTIQQPPQQPILVPHAQPYLIPQLAPKVPGKVPPISVVQVPPRQAYSIPAHTTGGTRQPPSTGTTFVPPQPQYPQPNVVGTPLTSGSMIGSTAVPTQGAHQTHILIGNHHGSALTSAAGIRQGEVVEPGIHGKKVAIYRSADAREILYKDTLPMDKGGFYLTVVGIKEPHFVDSSAPLPDVAEDDYVFFFDYASARVRQEQEGLYDTLVEYYQKTGKRLTVMGESDGFGSVEYNTSLAIHRSMIIVNTLVARGVAANDIELSIQVRCCREDMPTSDTIYASQQERITWVHFRDR